jgi:hypothetical protein
VKLSFLLALACLIVSLGSATPALAGDAASRAQAVQLFDEAEALFAKEQIAEACPKYAESYRLDPHLGVLILLAECYEKNGQLASAWGSFREAEEIAQKSADARGDQARKRAAALEPRLSYLVIEVPESVRVPGLEVLRDGAPVAAVLWGARAAVDSGTHQIEVRARGHEPWQSSVEVTEEGRTATVQVPELTPLRDAPPTPVAGNASDGSWSTQRTVALVVGGLGLAGVGVGGYFGLSAKATFDDSEPFCGDADYCTPAGDDLRSRAKSKALVATVATSAGAAALVTAGVLWFTAPKPESSPSRDARRRAPRDTWLVAAGPVSAEFGLGVSHAF